MANPENETECPICGKSFKRLPKHLKEWHSLKNSKERLILNSWPTGGSRCVLCIILFCLADFMFFLCTVSLGIVFK